MRNILRPLQAKDAPYMLEWLTDPDINRFFRFDASDTTLDTVLQNIEQMKLEGESKHFAVVNEADEYQGTISLKNINQTDGNAEYAVSMRKCAMGTGAARQATTELINYAFKELGLLKIYLNVLEENTRARRFYEKMGFAYEGTFRKHINIKGEYHNLCWYAVFKEDNCE